ncbi:acyl-CoA thioesterase [Stakelama saccharophila]|uniref:Acyl-CoA thioesterase n=1 Tax=Stakelama saccharophila TaxID=3075605 RepID=A0ABZ0B9V5_9SPHN|nr:acyl-CoA thioesterase [Stakelama sp. W311]WNO54186.1 acyl-CoA thioesterase [Stakelama sp. W311]
MTPFTQQITARAEDIDELGHVNNAVWVAWIQQVAIAHWNAVAAPDHRARYICVVTRHEIDYRGNMREGETVVAETWVPEAPKGARFDRHMRFLGGDGKVKVEAVTTWAIIDRETERIVRVPDEVAAPFLG